MNQRYRIMRDAMLSGFSVSFALKNCIREFDGRDPVDALKDAEALAELQRLRVEGAQGRANDGAR